MKTIMVVDDDQTTQVLMSRMLASLKMKIIAATNSNDAVSLALEFVPDLILMDIRLPGTQGNGWAIAEFIRNHPKLKHIPIVIFTAGSLDKTASEVRQYEAYFQKPFHVRELVACIQTFLT